MTQLVETIVSPLGAIEAFAATDKVTRDLGNSVWEQFARYVTGFAIGLTVADISMALKASEDVYKSLHKEGTPASYRSAKSTALGALARGISLLDPDGDPVGKSAIASMCRDHDAKEPIEQTGATEADYAIVSEQVRAYTIARFQRAAAKLSKLALSQDERARVRTTCEALINGLVVTT